MESPVFPDKKHKPTDADLAAVLGRAQRHWDTLKTQAFAAAPEAVPEWKYYMRRIGWTFILRGKRRNVLYMRPTAPGRFNVTFIFGDKAVQTAEESDLPHETIEALRNAPKYSEGRGINITVTSTAHVKIATKLLAIKVAH